MKSIYKQKKVNGIHIDEHRFIMEKELGRKLSRLELVHHIDNNKLNNDIANLEVVSPKEHSIIHNQKLPVIKQCVICGNDFEPHPTKRRRQQTCSHHCKLLLMRKNCSARKLTDFQVNEIIRRRLDGESLKKLALEYGVTEAAISYNIHHRAPGSL